MELQKIVMPEIGKCTEKELYFRECNKSNKRARFNPSEQCIYFQKNEEVYFDTYFNGLSIEKWKKYTIVNDVFLNLRLLGSFKIQLLEKRKVHDDIIQTVLLEKIVTCDEITEVVFPYENGNAIGMYTFQVEALSENAVFYGGYYGTNVDEMDRRTVKLGLGICTFRREKFVEKNIGILKKNILDNENSPLYGNFEVFISDNGKTLDSSKWESNKIHLFPNKNLGGAGGFTRDLIEIISNNSVYGITHVLLMDDDVVIEPEALVKTYTILALIKDEYLNSFIGGAMLRLDKQSIQVESGARWNGGNLDSLKHGLDLKSCDACLYNEMEESPEFNAWWYCCFPISVVREDNLPLPIFIRGDDLEYGLRNMTHLILMNGICVWHEPFENKYSSFLEYYIIRNQLIDNAFHYPEFGTKQLKRLIKMHCWMELVYYRYKNIDLYLRGVSDFLKGPQWLMQQDGEQLHKEIMASGYKAQDIDSLDMPFSYPLYDYSSKQEPKMLFRQIVTLNGLLLPTIGDYIVPMARTNAIQFYRKKRVMQCDIVAHKAFITERSVAKSFKYLFKIFAFTTFIVPFKLKKAQNQYRTEGLKLRTLKFWKEYLEV